MMLAREAFLPDASFHESLFNKEWVQLNSAQVPLWPCSKSSCNGVTALLAERNELNGPPKPFPLKACVGHSCAVKPFAAGEQKTLLF